MNTRVAIFLAAVVLIGVMGAAAVRNTDEAWLGFQNKYTSLAASKGGSAEPVPIEVKQDRLQGFGEERIDRCRSCHVAVDDPRFADEQHPLKTHPSIAPHTFNEMGCSVCHEGDGRATTEFLAHGKDHFWPEPLLTERFIEASCARCHPAPYLAQTPHLARGRELFEKSACMGCHKIQGLSRGNLGVELTEVGLHRSVEFFQKKLREPLFNVASTLMPKLKLSDEDIADLAVFLKSLKGRPWAEDPLSYRKRLKAWSAETPPASEPTAEAGKVLVEARGCLGCHKLGELDGGAAPDLTHLGDLRDLAYVEQHLVDPRVHTPGSNMPNFWLSATERKAIATYLTAQAPYQKPADPKDQYAQLCARCHGEKGDGQGLLGQSVLPRPRVFTNVQFFNWLPEDRAKHNILDGVPGTAMPPFKRVFTDEEAKNLFAWIRTNFLKSQRDVDIRVRTVPAKNPVPYSAESITRAKAIFLQSCYGCHGRIGDGKGPNAPEMLPRPRNLTNHSFFAGLPDTRLFESITYGIVGTGMPPWDMYTEDQRWDLVNYVRYLSSTGPASEGRGNP